jgi:DegV family protein with EDD domain
MNVAIESVNTFVKKDIRLVDSKNLSSGIGLLVLKAAELRDQGLSLDEIEKEIRNTVPKVRTAFVIDTLEYLYKGGRCSAMENVMGSLLHIRPIINVRADGTLGVKEKISGSRKKALNALLADFERNKANIDMHRVFITHSGCEEDAEMLQKSLLDMAPIEEICITVAGATIASHCGPATIGILYLLK